jgi:major vault protein
MKRDVYLRVDNNFVTDIVAIETKDLVEVAVKLSYKVNLLREHQDKWFSVENYVKYLCDNMRSRLKGALKKRSITEVMDDSSDLIRDVVLGEWVEGLGAKPLKRARLFTENGLEVYDVDVEVLDVKPTDVTILSTLKNAQMRAVQTAITLTADEQNLKATRRRLTIQGELAELDANAAIRKEALVQEIATAKAETVLLELEENLAATAKRSEVELAEQATRDKLAEAELTTRRANDAQVLATEEMRTKFFKDRVAAITPDIVAALHIAGDKALMENTMKALAPLALAEHQGLGQTIERLVKDTPLQQIVDNVKSRRQKETVGA